MLSLTDFLKAIYRFRAREVITESAEFDQWTENFSSEPAILMSVDLFKE